MKINSININQNQKSPAFTSRNAEIRFAEDIMRAVNNNFPSLSTTKMMKLCNKRNAKSSKQFVEKINALEEFKRTFLFDQSNAESRITEYVRKNRLRNCGEAAFLTKMALNLNGIKNAKIFNLYGFEKLSGIIFPGIFKNVNLDHAIVIVNMSKNAKLNDYRTFGKKAYVVDAWSGFVDYAQTAFKRYADEKSRTFIPKNKDTLGVQASLLIPSDSTKFIGKFIPELKMKRKN